MKILDLLQTRYTEFENQVKVYLSKTLKDYDENYGNNTTLNGATTNELYSKYFSAGNTTTQQTEVDAESEVK